MYKLRPYQQAAVDATIAYFRRSYDPAVLVLPTGAGKSLVIAELARVAKGRVLILTHVKELVEQNHEKFESYGEAAGIYSAGVGRKDTDEKVVFGSIQSVARAPEVFFRDFSLLIIDECHRISDDADSQYMQSISRLREQNVNLKVLGLTATPYRMGMGWIYEYHYFGMMRSTDPRFFKKCIFEVSMEFMIEEKFLTCPIKIDAPVACYDFSSLQQSTEQIGAGYSIAEIQKRLTEQKRVTPGIIQHIVTSAKDRQGVMIFTSSVAHAKEILNLLPPGQSSIVLGDTDINERNEIIKNFKNRDLKFLVNVSVLTTGFDAPHVDLIAVLRPTESVGLFQQIVGRGLRLSEGKADCLILDYTGQGYDIFDPEIGMKKPSEDSEPVLIPCPECGYENTFWGTVDAGGNVVEHFGRKCQGAHEDPISLAIMPCSYRFRFKICELCGQENDIAARQCHHCQQMLIDPDDKLKKAMELRDSHVMRPDTMVFERTFDKKKRERLEVSYYDLDGERLREFFYFQTSWQAKAFFHNFEKGHSRMPGFNLGIENLQDAIDNKSNFRMPTFVVARKKKYFWVIREKIFLD